MISRAALSTVVQGQPKYRSMLAGNTAFSPAAFESIATALPNGTSQTVTFTSIPQTYKHLQLRGNVLLNNGGQIIMNINSTDTNQRYHTLQTAGSTPIAFNATGLYISGVTVPTSGYDMPTAFIVDLHNYTSTTQNKTIRFISGQESNGTYYDRIQIGSGAKFATTEITSIQLANTTGSLWDTGSTISLYGIKG